MWLNKIFAIISVGTLLILFLVFEHHLADLLYERLRRVHTAEYVRRYRVSLKVWSAFSVLLISYIVVLAPQAFGVCVGILFAVLIALGIWTMLGDRVREDSPKR